MAKYTLLDDDPAPAPKAGKYVLLDDAQEADMKRLADPTTGMSTFDKVAAGAGKAVHDLGMGAGQLVGLVSRDDVKEQRKLDKSLMETTAGKVGNFAGNAAITVPTMMIPGANTVTGAGLVGAATGLLQPSASTAETAANVGLGGAAGAGGQWLGNKVASSLQGRLADKTAEAAAAQSRNSMRDATLAEGRAAGYKVPNSEVAPSFLGNRLESLGGKAAIKQKATIDNQQVTNALARKALGIADDTPISQGTLDNLRKTAGKAYAEVASLSPQAASDLEALKVARNEAQGWFNAYNRSARPDDLAKAKAARTLTDELENALEQHAADAGKDSLIPALREARQQIAKTYTVERALNKATGDVSAPVLGRLFDKGKPLSDGLDTVGKFNQAFPKFTGNAASTPAAGVSKVEALSGALMGGAGAALTGSPAGLAAAALPLVSHPARALALSRLLQATPEYGAGTLTKLGAKLPPKSIQLLTRLLALPAGQALAAE